MFGSFGNLKERLESVRHDVSQGWRTISDKAKSVNQKIVRKTTLLTEEYIEGQDQSFNCDIEAGSEILERYHKEWTAIHEKSRLTSKEAENVDKVVTAILKKCTNLRNTMTIFHGELDKLPEVIENVQSITNDIEAIGSQADTLEILLMDLEEVCEKLDVERHKNSHQLKMVMLQQSKLDDLEKLKEDLLLERAIRNQKKEKIERQESIERQKVYEDAFLEQMNYYIQFGKTDEHVSSLVEPKDSLADIKLVDSDLDKQLDVFLGPANSEESEDPSIPSKTSDRSKHRRKSAKTKSSKSKHQENKEGKSEGTKEEEKVDLRNQEKSEIKSSEEPHENQDLEENKNQSEL